MEGSVGAGRVPQAAVVVLGFFAVLAATLLATGRRDYPELHTILDTADAVLSGILALLLWDMGRRAEREFAKWLAVSFAATFLLEAVHVLASVDWSGALAPIAEARTILRPSTWPPAAHLLPLAVGASLWRLTQPRGSPAALAGVVLLLGAGLLALFHQLSPYLPPGPLGITRPFLILVPVLWVAVGVAAWRLRQRDRMARPLTALAVALVLGHLAMLYSHAPHDTQAMVAHLGKVSGYLILLISVMQLASQDMSERVRAEEALSRANADLDRRVAKRTTELAAANETLTHQIAERRHAEERAVAQLERLALLHQITRAIGDRLDLESIFRVVVNSVERQLPVDFACLCAYDAVARVLTVQAVGANSRTLARDLAMPEGARVPIDENGLSACVGGRLVYEPDLGLVDFAFAKRLAARGLRSLVAAPLQVENEVFGALLVARFDPQAFVSGECEFLRHLSEHVALAAHQVELHSALQTAYDDLRQSQQTVLQQERLRALGQMASGIAHDINNALSPVALYTDSMLEKEAGLTATGRGQLEVIRRAVEDVSQTIARMREFYRQREPQLATAPVQLNELAQQVLDLTKARWRDMALQRGVVVDVRPELAPDLPTVLGVESEIREALINLVFNAIDAMSEGGVLTVRTTSTDAAAGRAVRIEVADTGVGMDPETRQRCLEPFFTTKGERGTGLGLAMVYGVAQRHGAELDIQSAPGEGAAVAMVFAAVDLAQPDGPAAEDAAPAAPLRILLVDDDPVLLRALCDALEADGHQVSTAGDGRAGVEAYSAGDFDVVVTDLGMPHVDGRQVAAAVKAIDPDTPVILLTGWGQGLLTGVEIPPHIDLVLGKPPKLREIRAALARTTGARDRSAAKQ